MAVHDIPANTLKQIAANMCHHVNLCIEQNGGNFQHLL